MKCPISPKSRASSTVIDQPAQMAHRNIGSGIQISLEGLHILINDIRIISQKGFHSLNHGLCLYLHFLTVSSFKPLHNDLLIQYIHCTNKIEALHTCIAYSTNGQYNVYILI